MRAQQRRRRVRTLGLGLCAAAASLAGCAGPTGSNGESTADHMPGAPIVLDQRGKIEIVVSKTPNFYADTTGRRFYGIAGVIAMALEGNRIVHELAIADPAIAIAEGLRERLRGDGNPPASATRTGLSSSALKTSPLMAAASAGAASAIAPAAGPATPGSAFRIRVRTVNWDFRPYHNDDSQLVIVYAARIEIESALTGEVLVSHRCEKRRSPWGEVTVARLLADNGRVLRDQLAEAGRQCLDTLTAGPMSTALGMQTSVARR